MTIKKIIYITCIHLFLILPHIFGIQKDAAVDQGIIDRAGQHPRSRTYTQTVNPIDLKRYEFMITESGDVIYKKDGDIWRYFGNKGYNLDSVHEFDDPANPPITITHVDMIAADGNKVMIKTTNDYLYFANIVDGSITLTRDDGGDLDPGYLSTQAYEGLYVTNAPDDYSIYHAYDWYVNKYFFNTSTKQAIVPGIGAEPALLLPLSRETAKKIMSSDACRIPFKGDYNFEFSPTYPLIPFAWPVVVKKRIWYKVKYTNQHIAGLDIIDIGIFDINKVSAAREKVKGNLENYYKKYGAEYRRPYSRPRFFDSIDFAGNSYLRDEDRDYCAFVDGTTNFYMLTKNGTKYQVWNLDEQSHFSSQWYKFGEYIEEKQSLQNDPLVRYDPNNWKKGQWEKRSFNIFIRLLDAFKNTNKSFLNIHHEAYKNDFNYAYGKISLNGKLRTEYATQWREVGKFMNGNDAWIWSALESVENPNYDWDLVGFAPIDHLYPYFGKSNLWGPGRAGFYPIKTPFTTMWGNQQFIFDEEPSLDVSMENIVVATSDKVYSICWSWGALDFTWRTRNKPMGSVGNNVMIDQDMNIYVPGEQNGQQGYFSQTLLPPSYLNDSNQRPTYDYPDKTSSALPVMPHQNDWSFIPLASSGFTNAKYEFVPQVPDNDVPQDPDNDVPDIVPPLSEINKSFIIINKYLLND